jgi:hypothetical protein
MVISTPPAPEAERRACALWAPCSTRVPNPTKLSASDRTAGQRVPLKRGGEQVFSRLPRPKVAARLPSSALGPV